MLNRLKNFIYCECFEKALGPKQVSHSSDYQCLGTDLTLCLEPQKMASAEEAKCQQFVLLAKGAKGRAVAECIMRATAEPGLFGYRELLAIPSVQEVRGWMVGVCVQEV